jgi:chromate transporter
VSSPDEAPGRAPAISGQPAAPQPPQVPLTTILREWGRIGCIGFGGPPTHIKLLRELCVERRQWLDAQEFEDAIAACNLLPGPASTQLAIFCAWRLRGRPGALAGGAAFIVPGLIVILALAALFLETSPPLWVLGAGAGAGAAVPAVAIHAGAGLTGASWQRRRQTVRWLCYLAAGAASAATLGVWLVLVIVGCGVIELTAQLAADRRPGGNLPGIVAAPVLAAGALGGGVLVSVAWVAFKVGALSFGGGFVIIPLMQSDAVGHYHWMTGAQFLNAVALGQITPGPVVQTVAVVGYAAAGLIGGILASVVAFSPSFAFILLGAPRFDQIRGDRRARAFLDGAGPAAIGAIFGSAIPLTRALTHHWQYAVLAGALILLLALRRGVVLTLLCAGAAGVIIALAGIQVHLARPDAAAFAAIRNQAGNNVIPSTRPSPLTPPRSRPSAPPTHISAATGSRAVILQPRRHSNRLIPDVTPSGRLARLRGTNDPFMTNTPMGILQASGGLPG